MWTGITRQKLGGEDSLCKRYDRCGMGGDRAVAAAGEKGARPATHDAAALGRGRAFLHGTERLSVADIAQPVPPYTTVQRYFYPWRDNGLLRQINHVLVMQVREQEGREASPTAGVIDSQSVKTPEAGGPRGFDAGKKVKGRKRHILTDTTGLLVGAIVHEASIEDRDGAAMLLASVRHSHPWLRHVFADGGYAGEKLTTACPARPMDDRNRATLGRNWRLPTPQHHG